ncbi:MAG: hypothetical protein ACNA7J_08615 [Wenzhouxiangella sp.]
MDTDDYTTAISFEELLRLAQKYGSADLAGAGLLDNQPMEAVEKATCPCVQGQACIIEALADEFERLAQVFRQRQYDVKPESCPDCETRWEDEGGLAISRPSRTDTLRM